MSYSFNVKAEDQKKAILAADAEFDKVIVNQPNHVADMPVARQTLRDIVGLLGPRDEDQSVAVSVSGYISWTDKGLTQANVSVTASNTK